MIRVRNQYKKNYTVLSNAAMRDKRLALDELGMLVYLSSHDDNFKISRDTLMERFDIGRKRIDRITANLKECGYLRIEAVRKKGMFAYWEWIVNDSPQVS